MTSDEFLLENPNIRKIDLVHEVIEWRDRAKKYKSLFHAEAEAHAKVRSQLKDIVYDLRQHTERVNRIDNGWKPDTK